MFNAEKYNVRKYIKTAAVLGKGLVLTHPGVIYASPTGRGGEPVGNPDSEVRGSEVELNVGKVPSELKDYYGDGNVRIMTVSGNGGVDMDQLTSSGFLDASGKLTVTNGTFIKDAHTYVVVNAKTGHAILRIDVNNSVDQSNHAKDKATLTGASYAQKGNDAVKSLTGK